jgi:competence protein ComEA
VVWEWDLFMDSISLRNGIGAAALVSAALLGGIWYGLPQSAPPPIQGGVPTGQVTAVVTITVHVSGQVAAPGLVALPADARLADAVAAAGGATRWAALDAVNLAQPVRDGERLVIPDTRNAAQGTPMAAGKPEKVDLNTASAAELENLDGVGPVLAARIVSYRDSIGRFETVEDLLDVPGIGEAKLAAIRDDVVVR